ncbi:MAG: polymer-forming cytoskeletal protein [Hyphomicrobiaceae bacterium]|nr:polymer-forming cytoskeletal protein [Hyphomicrobiaceae bacterium]
MLSNFGSKKSEQEADKLNTAPQQGSFKPGASTTRLPSRSSSQLISRGERGDPSIIGPDLKIQGNLISTGEIQVDGEIEGDIHATYVLVGEKARVQGAVNAEEVIVRGYVMGSVRGGKVMLQATCHVEGDVHHRSLSIEQGGYFEGKSRRSDDPLAGIQQPQLSVPPSCSSSTSLSILGNKLDDNL